MSNATVLVVPGFHGSGPSHWQSWLETQLPEARRVGGIDWEQPVLADWALAIRDEIDAATGAVWIVAHSFGCLASIVAMADRTEKVAGAILVAPADPNRFSPVGVRDQNRFERRSSAVHSVKSLLPDWPLSVMGLVVASSTDPWMAQSDAREWARRWGFVFHDAGDAGHINVESGHGPWPLVHNLLQSLRLAAHAFPVLGSVDSAARRRGRGSVLANVRKHTRRKILYV
ncbi:MAG: alpha/beta hydrolase [Gammaproteobacteria bacterium]|nr:alpha/beta hydrolase [Gammaproteobacteria bacterium]